MGPDVFLARQDGRVLEEAIDGSIAAMPERVHIFLLDGMHHGELLRRLALDDGSIPHLRRLAGNGCVLSAGSVTNFPSITWPSHNAIGTGAWCGHHGIVNPFFYQRDRREVTRPQDRQFETENELSTEVETLYEAVARVYGRWHPTDNPGGALTAAINEPCGRGAVHASLERRLVGDRQELIAITASLMGDISPRWLENGMEAVHGEAVVDTRGTAQAVHLYGDRSHPAPVFVFQELVLTDGAGHDYGPHSAGARAALEESDVRIGRVLEAVASRGLLESTLFVVTSDHGMAVQNLDVAGHHADRLAENVVAGVATERFLYLHDLAVELERVASAVEIRVSRNDRDADGTREPLQALITAYVNGSPVASYNTDLDGRLRLPGLRDEDEVEVQVEGYNPRRLRADGSEEIPDLRAILYGVSPVESIAR
jgi:predicted AlkP superfamily pyrophosphatase or phosphodiesterase